MNEYPTNVNPAAVSYSPVADTAKPSPPPSLSMSVYQCSANLSDCLRCISLILAEIEGGEPKEPKNEPASLLVTAHRNATTADMLLRLLSRLHDAICK